MEGYPYYSLKTETLSVPVKLYNNGLTIRYYIEYRMVTFFKVSAGF